MADMKQKLLTVPECAQALGVAESTVRAWIAERKLESTKVVGVVRVRESAIEALVNQGLRPAVGGDE